YDPRLLAPHSGSHSVFARVERFRTVMRSLMKRTAVGLALFSFVAMSLGGCSGDEPAATGLAGSGGGTGGGGNTGAGGSAGRGGTTATAGTTGGAGTTGTGGTTGSAGATGAAGASG